MKLSIIVPAYNEEDNIIEVLSKIECSLDMPHELVVVNDHSTDNTAILVAKLSKQFSNIRLVENRYDRGFANALRAGFDSARSEVVIPVMADLCDELNVIKTMLEKINEGYDIVCGSRYMKQGARLGGSRIKGFFSSFVGRSLYYLLGVPTHDIPNAFKMLKKSVIDNIDIKARGFEVSMEITLKAYYAGYRITEVPTIWRERTKGKSSFKMFRLFPAYLKLYLWGITKKFTG